MYSEGYIDCEVVNESQSDPDGVNPDGLALNLKVKGDITEGADHGGCDDGDTDDVNPLVAESSKIYTEL